MPTLGELKLQFGRSTGEKVAQAVSHETTAAPNESGQTKIATATIGGPGMKTLQDIYLGMTGLDKEASYAPATPVAEQGDPEDAALAEMAEKIAAAEAEALARGEQPAEQEQPEMLKVAAEYDAAGRIMARGFYDEFQKLAASVNTEAAANQHTESPSAAKTPAFGNRGLPTVETNFAGSPNHDQGISMKGGKEVHKNVLEPSKKIKAGVTGDDPEAAAVSLGGGAPSGFATVRNLM